MNDINSNARRDFLKSTLAVGVGMTTVGLLAKSARAADMMEVSKPGMAKPVKTEELFRLGVIGPAELSLVTSELALTKATNANTKEFAGFEHTEAITITTVLKELGTPVPEMDAKGKEIFEMLKSASGADFDKAYIKAQLANHEFLRDHAEDYLKSTDFKTMNPAEQQTQHLAQVTLAVFKEHVAICKRIYGELGA